MRLVLAVVLTAVIIIAAEKTRDWQTGRVLDTEHSRIYLGTTGGGTTNGTVYGSADGNGNVSGTYSGYSTSHQYARYAVEEVEVIDGGQYVYVVARVLRWRWSKTANLTVNAPVQFAVDKRMMYVLDDDGREHRTKIVKRILKVAANPAQATQHPQPLAPVITAPPQEPAATASSNELVQVQFVSKPAGAVVSFTGVPFSRAPFSTKLPPGTYAVKMTLARYADWTGTVTVEAGKPSTVVAEMAR
jgi:hypothetical protein